MTATTVSFGPRFSPRTAPVTFWYVVAAAGAYLALFLIGGDRALQGRVLQAMVLLPSQVGSHPWTIVTMLFCHLDQPFMVAFSLYVCWWVGTDAETWWGSRLQVGFMVAMAGGLTAALLLANLIRPVPDMPIMGSFCLIAGWMTIYALRGPGRQVILIVFPVPAWVIAALTLAGLWFTWGPLPGLFAVAGTGGLAALYYYHGHRLHTFLRRFAPDPAKREKRARDRRFKRLMRRSGLTDVDKLER